MYKHLKAFKAAYSWIDLRVDNPASTKWTPGLDGRKVTIAGRLEVAIFGREGYFLITPDTVTGYGRYSGMILSDAFQADIIGAFKAGCPLVYLTPVASLALNTGMDLDEVWSGFRHLLVNDHVAAA